MLRIVAPLVLLALSAFGGAWASQYMRNSGPFWPYLLTGLPTLALWIWIVRVSPYNLTVTTVLWDVIYNGVWISTMIFVLHEVKTWTQAVGAAVVVVGLVLMGIRG